MIYIPKHEEKPAPMALVVKYGARIGLVALVVMLFLMPSARASAQSFSFDFSAIDLQPFFDGLQTWLPLFISIFGFVGAIVGAMALARTLINAVIGAFRGQNL